MTVKPEETMSVEELRDLIANCESADDYYSDEIEKARVQILELQARIDYCRSQKLEVLGNINMYNERIARGTE